MMKNNNGDVKMKKKITLLLTMALIFTACFAFSGCGNKVENDIWVVTYETDSGSDYTYEDIQVDENGNVISQREGANTYIYEYNEDGLLVKETRENTLYGIEINTYEYDENGLVVRTEEDNDGSITDGKAFTYSYTFDDEGRVASMKSENVNGEWSALTEYTYNDDGSIDTATEHSSKVYVTKFYYDENGNVIRTFTTADGWTRERTFEYENMGTYSYDEEEMPLAEKYRAFRTNYRK